MVSKNHNLWPEPKLDTYAGLTLGYWNASWSSSNALFAASGGGIRLPIHVGARYFFTDKLAGVAELGWGIAYLNIGIGYKL